MFIMLVEVGNPAYSGPHLLLINICLLCLWVSIVGGKPFWDTAPSLLHGSWMNPIRRLTLLDPSMGTGLLLVGFLWFSLTIVR